MAGFGTTMPSTPPILFAGAIIAIFFWFAGSSTFTLVVPDELGVEPRGSWTCARRCFERLLRLADGLLTHDNQPRDRSFPRWPTT